MMTFLLIEKKASRPLPSLMYFIILSISGSDLVYLNSFRKIFRYILFLIAYLIRGIMDQVNEIYTKIWPCLVGKNELN